MAERMEVAVCWPGTSSCGKWPGKAQEYDKHSGCSQSVLLALQEAFGIGDQQSFKAASVLSGGIARRGETCGAVIGALMALGLVMGREEIEDTGQYRKAMGPAREIIEDFQREIQVQFGFPGGLKTTICRDVQEAIYGRSFDMTDADEYQAFVDAGGHSDAGCPRVCAVAARVGAEKLLELEQAPCRTCRKGGCRQLHNIVRP